MEFLRSSSNTSLKSHFFSVVDTQSEKKNMKPDLFLFYFLGFFKSKIVGLVIGMINHIKMTLFLNLWISIKIPLLWTLISDIKDKKYLSDQVICPRFVILLNYCYFNKFDESSRSAHMILQNKYMLKEE